MLGGKVVDIGYYSSSGLEDTFDPYLEENVMFDIDHREEVVFNIYKDKPTAPDPSARTVPCYHAHDQENWIINGRPSHLLALLSVCRQVHAETRLLPFKLNVFDISILPPLDDWGWHKGRSRVDAIRTLRIIAPGLIFSMQSLWCKVLGHFTGAETLGLWI